MGSVDGTPKRPRERRALSHLGGEVQLRGPRQEVYSFLKRAFEVEPDERTAQAHVHGFHSYPARLHPVTAARLIEAAAPPGGVVLDPFCGSGTVLVEAAVQQRRARGVDANPLAIELARLKTRPTTPAERAALQEAAEGIAAFAEERRLAKSGPSRRYPHQDLSQYAIHVLLELDSLRCGIAALPPGETQRALRLVLSALLTKFSKKPGDDAEGGPRRYAKGFVTRFFVKKTADLCQRSAAYTELLGERGAAVDVTLGDARRLSHVPPRSVDLIVTSPPYPGVYDYYEQHATRLRWLELPTRGFQAHEIGARRNLAELRYDAALSAWQRDFGACLDEMRRVLKPQGRAVLVIADSVVGGRALYADQWLKVLGARHGLELAAQASQARPYFHRATARAFAERPRAEHLLLLEPRRSEKPPARRRE